MLPGRTLSLMGSARSVVHAITMLPHRVAIHPYQAPLSALARAQPSTFRVTGFATPTLPRANSTRVAPLMRRIPCSSATFRGCGGELGGGDEDRLGGVVASKRHPNEGLDVGRAYPMVRRVALALDDDRLTGSVATDDVRAQISCPANLHASIPEAAEEGTNGHLEGAGRQGKEAPKRPQPAATPAPLDDGHGYVHKNQRADDRPNEPRLDTKQVGHEPGHNPGGLKGARSGRLSSGTHRPSPSSTTLVGLRRWSLRGHSSDQATAWRIPLHRLATATAEASVAPTVDNRIT